MRQRREYRRTLQQDHGAADASRTVVDVRVPHRDQQAVVRIQSATTVPRRVVGQQEGQVGAEVQLRVRYQSHPAPGLGAVVDHVQRGPLGHVRTLGKEAAAVAVLHTRNSM